MSKKICKKTAESETVVLFDINANKMIVAVFTAIIILYSICDLILGISDAEKNVLLPRFLATPSIKSAALIFGIVLYFAVVFPLFFERFEVKNFCLMNPSEPICDSGKKNLCFGENIPEKFTSKDLAKINHACAVNLPAGYSIFIENFDLMAKKGPENFVLIDSKEQNYKSQVKWEERYNIFWKNLDKTHPLRNEAQRRKQESCVKTLKVRPNSIL